MTDKTYTAEMNRIQDAISNGSMTAPMVFTKMRELVSAATLRQAGAVDEAMVRRAYEVVHHERDCRAVGGNGDKDCRCDAVPFLRDLEALSRPASSEPASGEAVALPMDAAPRDGTMLRLLVRFEEHATDDAEEAWTIGANSCDANGFDEWKFAGWCWSHDHFTEGKGTPIGWLPMHSTAEPVKVPEAIMDLAECRKAGWNDCAPAYRAGWNACRTQMLYFAAAPGADGEVGA